MSRVRWDSSRSVSASSAGVIDTPAMSSSRVAFRLLGARSQDLFLSLIVGRD